MKLRSKLLLGVGILLLLMVVILYFVPVFFAKKDVQETTAQVHELLIKSHLQLVKNQQAWLANLMDKTKQDLNAVLFMLYEQKSLSKNLAFSKDTPATLVWNGLAKIAGYNPDIGFLQAHSPDLGETAVVLPQTATLYPILSSTMQDKDLTKLILTDPNDKNAPPLSFIGTPLPKELQTEKGYTLYALLDPDKVDEELAQTHLELGDALSIEEKRNLLTTSKIAFGDLQQTPLAPYLWAVKIELIQALVPLAAEGFQLKTHSLLVPKGMARLDQVGNGLAILSSDLFRNSPLFDDKLFYETHPPKGENVPTLAAGSALVTDKKNNEAFISSTLLLDSTFLSIGTPVSTLTHELALSANRIVLVQVDEDFWIGFDKNGQPLKKETIQALLSTKFQGKNQGIFNLDKKQFFFTKLADYDDGKLIFYQLHLLSTDGSIIDTLLNLQDKLAEKISSQLAIVSLITMALVLLFIGRISFRIIKPITKLAEATNHVASGRYKEIKLPDMGKRKDEVAILTRSFGEMVKGLADRERIRGVLDKVVSKEVADEILRTQIHLGGEDRIVSMLFGDIRGFTRTTENLAPQKAIGLLNECMTLISRVIEGEGGVIDKYVGDEVMAIYGAPTTHPDHALRAVSSAILILESLKKWNDERVSKGLPSLEMGIGIHSGLVVAGNMGAEDRLNYTVIGANVNLAARLCEAANGNQLLISEATLAEPNVGESFFANELPPIELKGFSEPVQIYEVTGFKWGETS
ncbi:MAG: Adenylate cyclase 2 [Chlamydiae bacterium]|nr:Adenylate cyclase 2 [Chlamydiota bacterium]